MKSICLNEIVERNTKKLNSIIVAYSFKYTLDQLLNDFTRVYIHTDKKVNRLRLMGFEKDYEKMTDKSVVTKRTQLFVLKKHDFEERDYEEIEHIKHTLNLFVTLYRELVTVRELEEVERQLSL